MNNLVPDMYKTYGIYSNTKMLPSINDGLTPVHRRILLSIHKVASDKFVKTSKVMGEMMSSWHPHNIDVGPFAWAVQNDFADGGGQWGTKIGTEEISPAAMRYTNIKENKKTKERALKLINYVKWEEGEMDPEPVYIPTMFPFVLIGKFEDTGMIGFGYKSTMPTYTTSDLCKRLLYHLYSSDKKICPKDYDKTKEFIPKPAVYGCKILSKDDILKQLLTTGIGKIDIQGLYQVDNIKKKIYIKGWNPRTKFQALLEKINSYNDWGLLVSGSIGYQDESNKDTGTKICFSVNKQRNTDDIFEKMCEAIKESLKSSITYSMFIVDQQNKIRVTSVDEMIKISFSNYVRALNTYYQITIDNLKSVKKELIIIKEIRPHMQDAMKNNTDVDIICGILEKKISKPEITKNDIIAVIDKYKIKKLMSIEVDMKGIDEKIRENEKCISNIVAVSIQNYETVKQEETNV